MKIRALGHNDVLMMLGDEYTGNDARKMLYLLRARYKPETDTHDITDAEWNSMRMELDKQ